MIGAAALTCLWSAVCARAVVGLETIPVGPLTEGLSISNQYTLSDGITFNLAGGTKPVIAQVGTPG